MTKFDLAAEKQRDLRLSANVFTAGYTGLTKGLPLSLDQGPDSRRPRDPSVMVGTGFICRDRFIDRELGPRGCIYHQDGMLTAMVYRAVVHTLTPEGRKPFSVLRKPTTDKPSTSLIKVSLPLPRGQRVKSVKGADGKNYVLWVWSGIRTTGRPVLAHDGEYLVELSPGDQLTIFFEDGLVRQYEQDKGGLAEIDLSPAEMAGLRINDATLRLQTVTPEQWPDPERREKQLRFILNGMVDLFHLAAKDEGVRKDLAQFFFNLPANQLALIHRKLVAVLHQRDPILAYALSAPSDGPTVVPMKQRVTDPDAAKKRADVEARRAQNRAIRDARSQGMKGTSGGGGGKQKGNQKGK